MGETVAQVALSGTSVIIDDVMYDEDVRIGAAAALEPLVPLFVGLFAPRSIVEERERGDRALGGGAFFYERAHVVDDYDVRIDTSTCVPAEAARLILAARTQPRVAFRRLCLRLIDER